MNAEIKKDMRAWIERSNNGATMIHEKILKEFEALQLPRWPAGPDTFQTFKLDTRHHPLSSERTRHLEKQMRLAFHGRRVKVLDHEIKGSTFWMPGSISDDDGKSNRSPKTVYRHLLKIELDAWIKEDDPVLTRWQKFTHWLLRKPHPKAQEPDRIEVYYTLTRSQYNMLKSMYAHGDLE